MSHEEEFSKWLRREEKSFEENLNFAIKSWQSVEFTLTTKYEIVLQWLTEHKNLNDDQILEDDFKQLLNLRAQSGLITQKVKNDFVEWFLQLANQNSKDTRKWCNLLHLLVEFELLQDLYRMNYEIQCRVYGELFSCYENYLLVLEQRDKEILSTFESEFCSYVLKGLKDTIKRCGDIVLFQKAYTAFALQPLAKVLLVLRTFKLEFFEEFLDIENSLCVDMEDNEIIQRILTLDLPVRLLCLECAIVKRRIVPSFLITLIHCVFHNFLNDSFGYTDPALILTIAAFVMEMFTRHDVSINIEVAKNQKAVKYLGTQVLAAVKLRAKSHLKEVLMLLCATLRLNPLILEQNVFEITASMILAPKSGNEEELKLFEEYLLLLMDMFRRLSRAEKFVINLLKALHEQLKSTDLSTHQKRKSEMDSEYETPKKKNKLEKNETAEQIVTSLSNKYLKILFQDFFKPTLTRKLTDNKKLTCMDSFHRLQNYWPSNPVGLAFSKIITGLVSKPSLTIWKTLLYNLKELIESLNIQAEIDENSLFQLDLQAALLSQYFAGCKLPEQSDKFLQEIKTQREFTLEVLKSFGHFLLEKEHQSRSMAAFLELVYFASNFELVLICYRPDGCNDESLQPLNMLMKLHNFLTPQEWTLLDQRVLNFGKSSCKHLLHRLKTQKSLATILLLTSNEDNALLKYTDAETLSSILKTPQAKWYLHQLKRNDKIIVADFFTTKLELLPLIIDDLELLEFISLAVYEKISKALKSKQSLLKTLSCDINNVRNCTEIGAFELIIKQLVDVVVSRSNEEYMVKKISVENVKTNLDMLSALPLGYLRRQRKTTIFILHLCLYHDLIVAQERELAAQALQILTNLLHFGQKILIFKYIPTSLILKLLPACDCWEIYEVLFSTVKNEEKGTDKFLMDLTDILSAAQSSSGINEDQRKLLLAAIETLTSLSGPSAKRMRKYLNMFLQIFSDYLQHNFIGDGTSKKDKKFVQKTLSGFASYASATLTIVSKAKQTTKGEERSSETSSFLPEVDENFRRMIKIYIGHSMDYRNPHAVRLMQVALIYREFLHLDQDEIEFVLTNYWSQINVDSKEDQVCTKTIEPAVKMIIGNKTNENLLLVLKTIANNVAEANFSNIVRLMTVIAKCPFSTIKGAIFNEEYKKLVMDIILRLSRDEQKHFNNDTLIVNILNCHQTVLDNKMIPMSTDTMDSILTFMMDINIKKFPLNDTNLKNFHDLHLAMGEVCLSFIKNRHILLMDRVPQYMHIFKDLVQAIVWYKSDRQKDTALPPNELDDLSELAMKLESLMHLMVQHKVAFKRVSPFVLTFIINLMVANKRPTTLYHKIKTHIESICYELIAICDHRVGGFILRCSNEAGRQLYEVLVKDYQKYHKFKGKV